MDLDKLKKGGNEIFLRLVNSMKGQSGSVHPQSLLCCVGALAGYSCQYDTRMIYMKQRGLAEDVVFDIVQDKQGRNYYFGELLNQTMCVGEYSVWSMIGGAVRHIGGSLPNLEDILRYVYYVVGSERFGQVRSCETGENAVDYVKMLWKALLPTVKDFSEEGQAHILFGICLQKVIASCKGTVDPTEMGRIAMEGAVSGSVLDGKKF